MSQDLRNFFKVIPKNGSVSSFAVKKKPVVISSDEDTPTKKEPESINVDSSDSSIIIEPTPEKQKNMTLKKRKIHVISSDSEDEGKSSKNNHVSNKKKKEDKPKLKEINPFEAFGSVPVKQSTVEFIPKKIHEIPTSKKETKRNKQIKANEAERGNEMGIHNDAAFEQTLLDLDEDFLIANMDILDKSINAALGCANAESTSGKLQKEAFTKGESVSRKRKISENRTVETDEERYEKKRNSAILYQKFINRGGPPNHGCKELPKGKADCLKGLCFLRTGVLDSLESDEFENLIKEHGGRIVHKVSCKVNYVVVGEVAGPAKLEKAKNFNIPLITEDELLDLIMTKSGLKPVYVNRKENSENDKKTDPVPTTYNSNQIIKPEVNVKKIESGTKEKEESMTVSHDRSKSQQLKTAIKKVEQKSEKKEQHKIKQTKNLEPIERPTQILDLRNITWTEKYKPVNIKGIIGQQGDNSNMQKLMKWLRNWHSNHSAKRERKVAKPSLWSKNGEGTYCNCALLSGPPGVGKTTTATLVAKELGFDIVEFNASDTRSKRLLNEEVSQLLSTTSLASFTLPGSKNAGTSKKRVLLMDEVDGMAGNEDRGGMQELIKLIKTTKIPIICMCNDRNNPKIRSLSFHCLDLRFSRPRVEQIKGAMLSICFKENIQIPPDALVEIISGTGMDVRQTLNHLSMWTASQKTMTKDEAQKEASVAKKDSILGPWEVVKQVFSAEAHKSMSIGDRERLFFYDYSIGPLFVQENYLSVMVNASKHELLKRAASTADSLSISDVMDSKMRSSNNWSLLPTQAIFSSILPGAYMEGKIDSFINFPAWLGKNSKRGKFHRILGELQAHSRTSISGSRQALNLDYLQPLRNKIIGPLLQGGANLVNESVAVMNSYQLLREDLDNIIELSLWPKQRNPMDGLDSKLKAAFTRTYNKVTPQLPYALSSAVKIGTVYTTEEDAYNEENAENSVDEDNDDVKNDAMIKLKKKPAVKAKKDDDSLSKAGTSKGKTKKGK